MKLNKLEATNFGSYKNLSIDFNQLGLCLVNGPTGAGKSTLLDLIPWCLFGKTAKGGKVDDIRNWTNKESSTCVSLDISINSRQFIIVRIRGAVGQNDLYILDKADSGITNILRHEDLFNTQVLINNLIGFDFDTYLSAAYFNEFSTSSSFFSLRPAEQKAMFEQITDLAVPKRLDSALKCNILTVREKLNESYILCSQEFKLKQQLEVQHNNLEHQSLKWKHEWELAIAKLEYQRDNFDALKEDHMRTLESNSITWEHQHQLDIASLQNVINSTALDKCHVCGSSTPSISGKRKLDREAQLQKSLNSVNPWLKEIEIASLLENTYQTQLVTQKQIKNPIYETLESMQNDVIESQNKIDTYRIQSKELERTNNIIMHLQDLVPELKNELIFRHLKRIEYSMNDFMERFFNAEFKLEFECDTSNLMKVTIFKDSYECNYKQLSKGQRRLLNLVFSISVMNAVSDHVGQHFDNLFFDEALDGLDVEFKLQAYKLFEELSMRHKSVLVVDHSEELKTLFSNKIDVKILNGESEITYDC